MAALSSYALASSFLTLIESLASLFCKSVFGGTFECSDGPPKVCLSLFSFVRDDGFSDADCGSWILTCGFVSLLFGLWDMDFRLDFGAYDFAFGAI